MINIVKANYIKDYEVELFFSDGSFGRIDFSYMFEKQTVLTAPLTDKQLFKDFFLDFGALCWKNGLEFSPNSLRLKLQDAKRLHFANEVA